MELEEFIENYRNAGGKLPEPKMTSGGFMYTFDFNSVSKSKREEILKQFETLKNK